MLFNSLEFLFAFLPFSLIGYFLCARYLGPASALAWLAAVSLAFYAYWEISFLGVLIASIAFNYTVARTIHNVDPETKVHRRKNFFVLVGIAGNLVALAYYKYSDFFISSLNSAAHTEFPLLHLVLPLGISFFTFTQIAFLVDIYRHEAKKYNFVKYVLFVSYFPHLIAGPIIHHKEMMAQFGKPTTLRPNKLFFSVGLSIFSIGLFKKVVFADGMGLVADPVFEAATIMAVLPVDAWGATIAYTLQIYFDFSGYSDMAIGLSYMIGIRLPVNFNSPYKSRSIIEFWRRWHMTLSRFLRDYLYISIGGNRKGPARRYLNLMVTMLIGGLWHGAGGTFIFWGGLHGLYLIVNHAWIAVRVRLHPQKLLPPCIASVSTILLTFLCVSFAWVFFRSPDMGTAFEIIHALAHSARPDGTVVSVRNVSGPNIIEILSLCFIAFAAPNSLQIMRRFNPSLPVNPGISAVKSGRLEWRPTLIWGGVTALVSAICILLIVLAGDRSQFLYFQF